MIAATKSNPEVFRRTREHPWYSVVWRCSGKQSGESTQSIGEAAQLLLPGRIWGKGETEAESLANALENRRVINIRMKTEP